MDRELDIPHTACHFLQIKCDDLQTELDNLNSICGELQYERDDFKLECAEVKEERDEFKRCCAGLRIDVDDMERDGMCIIADLREQLSSAEQERLALDCECSDLQRERDELQHNYDEALKSLAELQETDEDSDCVCD